jgi:hypothetical protein
MRAKESINQSIVRACVSQCVVLMCVNIIWNSLSSACAKIQRFGVPNENTMRTLRQPPNHTRQRGTVLCIRVCRKLNFAIKFP